MKSVMAFLFIVTLGFLAFPASASDVPAITPAITSWGNSKTNDSSLTLTINVSEVVRFNATADQTIATWSWFKDNINQSNNYDNFSTSWDSSGIKNLSVNATNDNGTSNTVNWTITVQAPAPIITSWSNNKTNDRKLSLTIYPNETVRFNATADQTIATWSWFKDNINQSNNYDNFSTYWDSSGIKNLSVNATNDNGTSNTVTWTITVQAPGPGAPIITSWSNNKTNNSRLSLNIYTNETVRFDVTANQPITAWLWTLNGINLSNPSDTLNYTFYDKGLYKVGVNGSNNNGTTQTITWNVTVREEKPREKKVAILSWYPQPVDYIYVNGTVNETIEYSITLAEPMNKNNWSVDGKPVNGSVSGNTYNYTHTWDNDSVGFHTVIYKGSNNDAQVEFRWYVNVYRIGEYSGGSIFDIIDEALENHVTDIKIRMFKYKIAKHEGNAANVTEKVNRLHDEIAKRQMTREALRLEFMAGNITAQEYVAALKQAQRDAKFNIKLANEMAKIAKEDLKEEKLSKKFENIPGMDDDRDKGKVKDNGKEKDKGNKGKGRGND